VKKRGLCRQCWRIQLLYPCKCSACRCVRKSARTWLCRECTLSRKASGVIRSFRMVHKEPVVVVSCKS